MTNTRTGRLVHLDKSRQAELVHLSITWDGLPDVHAASDFGAVVDQLAVEHFAQLRPAPREASIDL